MLLLALGALVVAGCAPRPFADSSPWNAPLSSSVGWRDEPALRAGHSWVNDESSSIPVVHSAPSDPLVAVSVPSSWGWPAGVVQVRVPAGVTGAAGDDGTLVVVGDGSAFDFWQFQRSDTGHARAAAWATAPLGGTGVGRASPFLGAGIRAAGSSAYGGLITDTDLSGNDMRHALAVSLLGSEVGPGTVPPAIADGGGGSGTIPMGSRLGIPRGTPMPTGLSPIGQQLWNTLVTYGALVVDKHSGSAPVEFYADPLSVSPDRIGPLRYGDLDRIMPAVRVVQ
jgi:hypothetical protein